MFHSMPRTVNTHRPVRLPIPNRHVTGQGHARTPQQKSH